MPDELKQNLTAADRAMLLEARERQANKIMRHFSAERIIYLIFTSISFIGLLYLIFLNSATKPKSFETLALLVGPTGILALCVGSLFRMFNKILEKVFADGL